MIRINWSCSQVIEVLNMDADGRVRVDSGTIEYYLNRLIQRAIVEPKPLLKIYEEECQR